MSPQQQEILLKEAPESAKQFITDAFVKLEKEGVKLILSEESQVVLEGGIRSSGFFEDVPLVFAVALGKPFKDWFAVFVHEYGHFTQYLEDKVQFSKINKEISQLFAWIDGTKELTKEDIKKYSASALWIEYDCEKRSLENIKKCQLTDVLDPVLYAQKANSYFNFYHYVEKNRCWYKGQQEPYTLPEVYELFPKEITKQSQLTPEQEKAYALCIQDLSTTKKFKI